MSNLTITISRQSVVDDVRIKSHQQAETIADATVRYKIEAGTEKLEDIHQSINDAAADVAAVLRPFLTSLTVTASANDNYDDSYALAFMLDVTPRKQTALAKPLALAIHKYIVDATLEKFYRDVNSPELATLHSKMMEPDIGAIENLIYRRAKPTYTQPQI